MPKLDSPRRQPAQSESESELELESKLQLGVDSQSGILRRISCAAFAAHVRQIESERKREREKERARECCECNCNGARWQLDQGNCHSGIGVSAGSTEIVLAAAPAAISGCCSVAPNWLLWAGT